MNGRVDLYYDNAIKLATTSTGIAVTGNTTFADNGKAIFGGGNDLQIYHDGSNSRITNTTGSLWLQSDTGIRLTNLAVTESMAAFYHNGAVENLYYDGTKKLGNNLNWR